MIEIYGATQKMTDTTRKNEDAFEILRLSGHKAAIVVDGSGNADQVAKSVLAEMRAFLSEPWESFDSRAAWEWVIRQVDMRMFGGHQATMAVVVARNNGADTVGIIRCVVGDARIYEMGPSTVRVLEGYKQRLGSGKAEPVLSRLKHSSSHILMSDGCWTPLTAVKIHDLMLRHVDHPSDRPSMIIDAAGLHKKQWGDDCTCVIVNTHSSTF